LQSENASKIERYIRNEQLMTRKHFKLKNARTRHKTQRKTVISSQHFNLLKHYWKSICKNKMEQSVQETTELTDSDFSTIRDNPMYQHIPKQIRHHFESTETHGILCKTNLKRGRNVNIYIAFTKTAKLHSKTPIYLNNIIAWLNFISEFASSHCSQKLNIFLLLNDAKKRIPEIDAEPIDVINANTAFTTACSAVNYIFVFRREEWFKVLMHETFHCFGLDFSSSFGDESNKHILSIFPAINPNTDVRLYETYCEMWAEIFYFMFCQFTKSTGECSRFSESRFIRELRREQLFSIFQSNKILNRSRFKYSDMTHSVPSGIAQYREKTQAFSYYVLKSLMLWNVDKFLEWCVKHNKKESPIQFDKSRIPEYCVFVEELVKTDRQYRIMTERTTFHKLLDTSNAKITMRMTANDPDWT
jgi:hypothetical protein